MPSKRMALLLAGLLVVSLLVSIPARLLGVMVPANTLVMHGLNGSLWHGSAARVLIATPGGYLHLGTVNWRLSPLSLLLFSPALDVESRWGGQKISCNITVHGSQDFDLEDVDASVSARLLRQFTPLMLGGRFSLRASIVSIREGQPVRAQGRAQWHDATWLAPQGPSPLGNYAVDFSQQAQQALSGQIVTLRGPVNASGSVELANNIYALDILLSADNGLDPQLQQAMSLIAQPVGKNFQIDLSGRL